MANFVNDAAKSNKLYHSVLESELTSYDGSGRTSEQMLRDQDEAIMAFDFPRATAVAHAIMQDGRDRSSFMSTVALAACRFQDDPHNQKISHSTFEEYHQNSTHLRDRLLLAGVRLLAGWPKMPGERDCYARFTREWIKN
jgi:hypothetical protein